MNKLDELQQELHETQNCIEATMRNKSLALAGLSNMASIESYDFVIKLLGDSEQEIVDLIRDLEG